MSEIEQQDFGIAMLELNEKMTGLNEIIYELNKAMIEVEEPPKQSNNFIDDLNNCINEFQNNPDLPIKDIEEIELQNEMMNNEMSNQMFNQIPVQRNQILSQNRNEPEQMPIPLNQEIIQNQNYFNNNIPNKNQNNNMATQNINVLFKTTSDRKEILNVPKNITMGELIKRFIKHCGKEKLIIESKTLFIFLYESKTYNIDSQQLVGQIIKNPNIPVVVRDAESKLFQSVTNVLEALPTQ